MGDHIVVAGGGSATPSPAGKPPSAEQLAQICSDIVGTEIPVGADLFVSGVTSLDLVRVVGVIADRYGLRLVAVDILDHPTSTALADHLRHLAAGGVGQQ